MTVICKEQRIDLIKKIFKLIQPNIVLVNSYEIEHNMYIDILKYYYSLQQYETLIKQYQNDALFISDDEIKILDEKISSSIKSISVHATNIISNQKKFRDTIDNEWHNVFDLMIKYITENNTKCIQYIYRSEEIEKLNESYYVLILTGYFINGVTLLRTNKTIMMLLSLFMLSKEIYEHENDQVIALKIDLTRCKLYEISYDEITIKIIKLLLNILSTCSEHQKSYLY